MLDAFRFVSGCPADWCRLLEELLPVCSGLMSGTVSEADASFFLAVRLISAISQTWACSLF